MYFRRYSSGRIILLEIERREVSYCLLYLFRKSSIFRPTSVGHHYVFSKLNYLEKDKI